MGAELTHVFRTHLDLNAHRLSFHSENMSRSEIARARTVQGGDLVPKSRGRLDADADAEDTKATGAVGGTGAPGGIGGGATGGTVSAPGSGAANGAVRDMQRARRPQPKTPALSDFLGGMPQASTMRGWLKVLERFLSFSFIHSPIDFTWFLFANAFICFHYLISSLVAFQTSRIGLQACILPIH